MGFPGRTVDTAREHRINRLSNSAHTGGRKQKKKLNAPNAPYPLPQGLRHPRINQNLPWAKMATVPLFALSQMRMHGLFLRKKKKLAAPKGVPERSPNSVLTGPCDG